MTTSPFIKIDNLKIRIEDLPEEAWEYVMGGGTGAPDLRKYFQKVAWLNRAVKIRVNHVSQLPFKIYRGETVVDDSSDYKNALGFLPSFQATLGMIEQGLTLNGREYQFIERRALNGRGVATGLRHLVASSIKPVIKEDGLQGFLRTINGRKEMLDTEQVLYFWYPDDSVEIGEPHDWPALAALCSAGVLYAVSNFAGAFFDKGAIKVTLLTTKGNVVEAERNRLKAWWDRIRGHAWASEIVNADAVEAVPVGEGLESLSNTDLTKEQREDVSTALGVPNSMMFSNAANYATSVQDKQNFYEDLVIPEAKFIASCINTQVLEPLGYRLMFDPQELAIFQEDEEQRSTSFMHYVSANIRPSIVGEMLGLALPDGVEYAALDEKWDQQNELAEKQAEAQIERAKNPPPVVAAGPVAPAARQADGKSAMLEDLEKWERKAIKRIKSGNDPYCTFASENIPQVIIGAREGALEATTNRADLVEGVFKSAWLGYP